MYGFIGIHNLESGAADLILVNVEDISYVKANFRLPPGTSLPSTIPTHQDGARIRMRNSTAEHIVKQSVEEVMELIRMSFTENEGARVEILDSGPVTFYDRAGDKVELGSVERVCGHGYRGPHVYKDPGQPQRQCPGPLDPEMAREMLE
jgi:hypothetical protein